MKRRRSSAGDTLMFHRLLLWLIILMIACYVPLHHWLVASRDYASIHFGGGQEMNGFDIVPTLLRTITTTTTHRHVLFGLSGNHSGFLAEFEVALKSVLLNAPSDPMTIHIIADEEAYQAMEDILNKKANLTSWYMPHPIHINLYNVQNLQEQWKKAVETRMEVAVNIAERLIKPGGTSLYRHTIGTYYRLFADEVLPRNVDNVLYLDTDAVVLSPLDGLWHHQMKADQGSSSNISNNNTLFYWGESQCAAFILLRLGQMRRMWDLFLQVPASVLEDVFKPHWAVVDDQFMLRAITRHYPDMVGTLSPEWDIHVVNGVWRDNKELLLPYRPKGAGMLHFNGGGISKEAYFDSHPHFKGDPIWGLARYYVDLPWAWARFRIASQLKDGQAGYQIKVTHLVPNGTVPNDTLYR